MAQTGATGALIIDKIYTTLNLKGRATFEENLVIDGNLNVGGNLFVSSDTIFITSGASTVFDKTIILNVNSDGSGGTDVTGNNGGIILKGMPNDHTILWTNDDDSWNFSENLNLSGSDSFVFRINGSDVLSKTTLGGSVVNSSLTKVGILDTGSISHSGAITAIATGNPVLVTAPNNTLGVSDQVLIEGTNSSPSLNGCFTVLATSDNGTFVVDEGVTIAVAGTAGTWFGDNFPIDIGVSSLRAGPTEITCGNKLIAKTSDNAVDSITLNGGTQQLDIYNNLTTSYAEKIETFHISDFNTVQRGLWIDNTTKNGDVTGITRAADITATYDGVNTTYINHETSSYKMIGSRSSAIINAKVPAVKISARGFDSTAIWSQGASNMGGYVEANNANEENFGMIGLANGGVVKVGIMGCVNKTRADVASDVRNNWVLSGGLSAGLVGCNPTLASDSYAIYGIGLTRLEGDTTVVGDLTVTGTVTGGSFLPDFENIDSNLTSGSDCSFDLGSASRRWRNLYLCDTAFVSTVDSITASTPLQIGDSNASVVCLGTSDTQAIVKSVANSSDFNSGAFIVEGGVGIEKDVFIGGNLNVAGNIIGASFVPDFESIDSNVTAGSDCAYDLGTSSTRWRDLFLCNTAFVGTVDSTSSSTGIVLGNSDISTVVRSTVGSSDSTSGALTVCGGIGVKENVSVGGNVGITGNLEVGGSFALTKLVLGREALTASGAPIALSTSTTISEITLTSNTTATLGNATALGCVKHVGIVSRIAGTLTLNLATAVFGASYEFDRVGQSASFWWSGSGWLQMGGGANVT